jgi:hypothetical protein
MAGIEYSVEVAGLIGRISEYFRILSDHWIIHRAACFAPRRAVRHGLWARPAGADAAVPVRMGSVGRPSGRKFSQRPAVPADNSNLGRVRARIIEQ